MRYSILFSFLSLIMFFSPQASAQISDFFSGIFSNNKHKLSGPYYSNKYPFTDGKLDCREDRFKTVVITGTVTLETASKYEIVCPNVRFSSGAELIVKSDLKIITKKLIAKQESKLILSRDEKGANGVVVH